MLSRFKMEEKKETKYDVTGKIEREQFFELESENELRILVDGNSDVKIELLSGLAEIYGTEMELNKEYSLLPKSPIFAIFTWYGCVVKVSGRPEAAYIVENTSMMLNVLLHASLEERRLRAAAENKNGPVVLVVGFNDVSKTMLCRLLLNYAVRLGRNPVYLDLDVGQSSISYPGTIGVLTVKKPADIVNGFEDQPVQVYPHGYRSTWQYPILYHLTLEKLNLILRSDIIETNQNVKTSGVIINGCDWSRGEIRHHGYGTTYIITKNFEIDVVCVLEEEGLYLQLQRDLPSSTEVIFIPKLDGAVQRCWKVKSQAREARLREYFYGPKNQLKPYRFEVKYSDIKVFKVSSRGVQKFTQFLGEVKPNYVCIKHIGLTPKLIDKVLALSSADDDKEDILYMRVIGFICVANVNMEKATITVISPHPAPLSKKILLLTETRLKKFK